MKEKSGFTLVEVLVAAGIMGLLALGAAKLFSQFTRAQKNADLNYEIEALHAQVMKHFRNPNFCSAMFAGKIFGSNTAISLGESDLSSIPSGNEDFYDQPFTGFNKGATTVKLVGVYAHNPIFDLSILSSTIDLSGNLGGSFSKIPQVPTSKGWETIVIFEYEKINSPLTEKKVYRYERMIFNNYLSVLVQAPSEWGAHRKCSGANWPVPYIEIVNTFSFPVDMSSQGNGHYTRPLINFYECSLRMPQLPILSCE